MKLIEYLYVTLLCWGFLLPGHFLVSVNKKGRAAERSSGGWVEMGDGDPSSFIAQVVVASVIPLDSSL